MSKAKWRVRKVGMRLFLIDPSGKERMTAEALDYSPIRRIARLLNADDAARATKRKGKRGRKPELKKVLPLRCPKCGGDCDGDSSHKTPNGKVCFYVIDRRGGWRQLGDYDG